MSGCFIDYETADRIALCVMKDQLKYLKEEVRQHTEEGKYMHPDDYHDSMVKLMPSLRTLIAYFGGTEE
jgi:hypothetical protein